MSSTVRIMCLGDVVGRPGRRALTKALAGLRQRHHVNLVIANGENASGGLGFDAESAKEIKHSGVDLVTLGDHTWQRSGAANYLAQNTDWCVRPANYPAGAPGTGWLIKELDGGVRVGLFNMLGRVYINSPLDCPFRLSDEILNSHLTGSMIRILDFHAGATSEKVAMGRYLDGRVSLVFGTHTHVQTADEQVLAKGTAYITDIGMCGAADGVIGMDAEVALARFLSGMHHSYKVAAGPAIICGIICDFDATSGKAISIARIQERLEVEG